MKNRIAEIEATQKGFRVKIVEAGKVIATTHATVNIAIFNRRPKVAADAAFEAAKQFAAQFGCE